MAKGTIKKRKKKIKLHPKHHLPMIAGFFAVLLSGAMVLFALQPALAACSISAPTTAAGYQNLLRGNLNGKWYHGDYGQSVLLPNGKTLWVYGDTLIGTSAAVKANTFIHNSAILVEKGCATPLTGTLTSAKKETAWMTPPAAIDLPNKDDYYWINTPFMDGSTLRIFLSHMYNDASGFHPVGSDIATFTISNGVPKLSSITKTPGSAGNGNTPFWGAAVVNSGNYQYIFGSINKHEPYVFGNYYYIARVPVGSVTNQSSWRYWNGSTWVSNQSAATAIIPGTVGLGASVSVYKKSNGTFVLISKKYDAFGTDLVAWKATAITGPWTEITPALIAPIPTPNYTTQDYTYLGLGHPELTLPSGKLLVTWSLGSYDASFFGDSRYGVYFSEVPKP